MTPPATHKNEKKRFRWLEEIDILDLVGMEAGKLDLQCECVRVAVTDLGKGIQPEQVVKAQPASGRRINQRCASLLYPPETAP